MSKKKRMPFVIEWRTLGPTGENCIVRMERLFCTWESAWRFCQPIAQSGYYEGCKIVSFRIDEA